MCMEYKVWRTIFQSFAIEQVYLSSSAMKHRYLISVTQQWILLHSSKALEHKYWEWWWNITVCSLLAGIRIILWYLSAQRSDITAWYFVSFLSEQWWNIADWYFVDNYFSVSTVTKLLSFGCCQNGDKIIDGILSARRSKIEFWLVLEYNCSVTFLSARRLKIHFPT